MREIQFRFWDKVENDWLVDGRAETNIYDFAFKATNWSFINKKEALNRVEVSQYIGIKDIHQKKVFQGDVVKVKNIIYEDCWREEIEEIKEYTGEVVWHQFGWHIAEKIENGTRYHSLWLWNIKDDETDPDTHFMEILGDRYNNPEMKVIK